MIRVLVDPRAMLGHLTDLQVRQLPFATMKALNRVANIGQAAERAHIKGAFRLRREAFVLRGIKIEKTDRATKSSWAVVIQVAQPQDFLSRAEKGLDHVPYKAKHLWMPNAAVFSDRIVSRKNPLHPGNLRFTQAGPNMKQGNQGTFMVKNAKGTNVVLQRVAKGARGVAQSIARGGLKGERGRDAQGRITSGGTVKGIKRGGVRLLYTLISRSRTPARLEFVSTITQAVSSNWNGEMAKAMGEAMRSAR